MRTISKRLSMLALAAALPLLMLAPAAKAADISLDGFLRGQCTTVSATGNGTASTATLNNKCGVVTSDALTIPTGSNWALTLTNSTVAAADIVLWAVSNGTNTTGIPVMASVNPAAGSVVFNVRQSTGTAFNGTISVRYFVIKP